MGPLVFQGKNHQNNTGDGTVAITFPPTDIANLTDSDYRAVYNGGGKLGNDPAFGWLCFSLCFNDAAPPTMDGFDLTFTAGGTPWAVG